MTKAENNWPISKVFGNWPGYIFNNIFRIVSFSLFLSSKEALVKKSLPIFDKTMQKIKMN